MLQESRDLLATLERLTHDLVHAVNGAPPEALDWTPCQDTNSAAAILTHSFGAARHWLVAYVGGTPSERDREAEFHALHEDLGDLQGRADRWIAEAGAVLNRLTTEELDAPCDIPASQRQSYGDLTNRGAILHVIEHLGTHAGHLDLTLQLWRAQMAPHLGLRPA
jgi:uncharacterized damage-inducible protein DinB